MMCDVADLIPAFRHLTGESRNICRLCFDAVNFVDSGISLDESLRVECFYYDDTVTYADMLTDLGAPSDPSLPQLLCKFCADLTMKAFSFQKLCRYSNKKWHESIERLNQTLNLEETMGHGVKTAYFHIQNESNRVITGLKAHNENTKEAVVETITKVIRRRHKYETYYKERSIICHLCGDKIKKRSISVHMKRKHNKKKFVCLKCDKEFKDRFCLRDHVERMHTPKTIPCPMCNKMFSTQRMLTIHNAKSHKAIRCRCCFKVFSSKVALKSHSETQDLHQCLRCSRSFEKKVGLDRHSKRCRDDPKIAICDICNKTFSNKTGVRSHLVTMHGFGEVYSCKWCKKVFDAVSKLKGHIVKHTRERNFSCDQCGGVFVTKAALTYHTRLHTGEKPYSCDVCGEKFLSASRRMDHKRRKHLEPRHVCSVCGSKFYSKFCLTKHFARHQNPQSKLFVSEF